MREQVDPSSLNIERDMQTSELPCPFGNIDILISVLLLFFTECQTHGFNEMSDNFPERLTEFLMNNLSETSQAAEKN